MGWERKHTCSKPGRHSYLIRIQKHALHTCTRGEGDTPRLGKMFVPQREVERGNSCLEQRLSCDPRLRQGRAFGSVRHLVTPSHSPTSTLQLPCPLLHAVEFPISIRKRPDGNVEVARKVPEGVGRGGEERKVKFFICCWDHYRRL